jgi:hypothetical protein
MAHKRFHQTGIGKIWHITQTQAARTCHQAASKQRKGRILSPANSNFSNKRHPALYLKTVHIQLS